MTLTSQGRWAPRRTAVPVVEVALVNNMPDTAFEETERQFTRLLRAGAVDGPVELRRTSVADPRRSGPVRRWLADRYEDLDDVVRRPPDALIVTGTEPRCTDLRDEVIWEQLVRLTRWALESTTSVYFSCLAAHGALLAMDGTERRRLPSKLSGVYLQRARPSHPLAAGLDLVPCPHSRLHDVPEAAVEACGYTVLLASPEAGWSVAVADGPCLTVLAQGHPEYSATTLLREYRRDVRRHLAGQLPAYPEVPAGYLDEKGLDLLDLFRRFATARKEDPAVMKAFPFDACAGSIRVDWRSPMERLFANWLAQVRARKAAGATASRQAG